MSVNSPTKRRALAPVDANTRSPLPASRLSPTKPNLIKSKLSLGASPIDLGPAKRPIELESSRVLPTPTKRRRLSETANEPASPQLDASPQKEQQDGSPKRRSASPEFSSLFDHSVADSSHITSITEQEVEPVGQVAPVTPVAIETRPRQRSMTREEARQKAEILRLRLGLASYKVRTNQADVPLERLQIRPLSNRFIKPSPSVTIQPQVATLPRHIRETRIDAEDKTLCDADRDEDTTTLPSQRIIEPSGSFISCASTEAYQSPTRRGGCGVGAEPILPRILIQTPERQRQHHLDDMEVPEVVDGERGGAAEGLLSLSQSSPASGLK
ncbi:hypothetical protein GGS20DRAFT_159729 [Poronia punctata]|nr:hypothetical protein GGS20DRAFT_159729 [Poronia punctata]